MINSCRHCRHEQSTERRSGAQGNEVSSAVTRPAQARADDLRRRCRATLDGVEGKCRARCSGTAFTQRLPTAVRHAIIGQLSAHTTNAGSANHLTQVCPGSARDSRRPRVWNPRQLRGGLRHAAGAGRSDRGADDRRVRRPEAPVAAPPVAAPRRGWTVFFGTAATTASSFLVWLLVGSCLASPWPIFRFSPH